eukprot:COSAG06_NODE_4723_length_4002_cov_22.470664_1_plen_71_part_10
MKHVESILTSSHGVEKGTIRRIPPGGSDWQVITVRVRAGGNIHTENLEVWFGVVSTLDYDALQIQMHTQEL